MTTLIAILYFGLGAAAGGLVAYGWLLDSYRPMTDEEKRARDEQRNADRTRWPGER